MTAPLLSIRDLHTSFYTESGVARAAGSDLLVTDVFTARTSSEVWMRIEECRLTVEFLNFSDDLCAFFFTATSQNDLSTSTSEFDRGGFADTGCSSGYECNFA